ncbi:hypothetical protein RQP46_005570 [Phenoliferia psychrophenolica]
MDKYDAAHVDRQEEKASSDEHLAAHDPLSVSEVTHQLPWTAITCLFWTSAITATTGGAAEGLWIGQAFQVTTAIVGPVLARIGDSCGRRWPILFGVFFGGIGVLVLSLATNINMAIAGSTVFGLSYGSGGNIFSVCSEILPRRHRGTAQICLLLGSICGVLLGLFVGANLIQTHPGNYPGWRSASFFNFGLHILTFTLFAIFYHPTPVSNPNQLSVFQRVMQIDWIGIFLLAAGICPLMVGLIWGGGVYAWSSATIIACLVVGIGMFFVLAIHQTLIKKDGLFTHALFENRNFLTCLLLIVVEGFIYNVFTHYYGVETAVFWEARPYFLALRFSVFVFAAAIAAVIYGFVVYKLQDAKWILVVVIGMATVTPGTDKATLAYGILCGAGFSAPLVFLNMVTQLAVKPELMGLATSLVISSRAVGGAVGIAITGAVFTSKVTVAIPAYVAKAAVQAGLPATSVRQFVGGIATSNATLIKTTPGVSAAIVAAGTHAIKQAYSDSFKFIWYVTLPFVSLPGLLTLKSTKKEMNSIVDRPVEDGRHKHESNA